MPVDADYLWEHGKTCLRWAQDCFDLSTATRLRLLGEGFLAKAAELESELPASHKTKRQPIIAARRPVG